MGRILAVFAEGALHVIPSNEIQSPKHQELFDKVCKLQERLEEKLNSEEKELLDELMDAVAEESSCYAQSKFIRGYRLGALMTMEVMSDQEAFLGRKGLK